VRITADDARQQRERIAQQLAVKLAEHALAPLLPAKRPVGRPKRQREAADVLAAAAAATTAPAAATIAPILPLDQPPSKRGKYTNWFASPFLPDILAAYSRCHSARTTVTSLRRAHPDGRFASLSHCTLQGWFDDQHQLLPRYQKLLDQHVAASGDEDQLDCSPRRLRQRLRSSASCCRCERRELQSTVVSSDG
jgi:hypothetical protein